MYFTHNSKYACSALTIIANLVVSAKQIGCKVNRKYNLYVTMVKHGTIGP